VLWKPARRRQRGAGSPAAVSATLASGSPAAVSGAPPAASPRALRGAPPEGPIRVREGALELWLDVAAGQKSGAYLDLRGLRRWVSGQDLRGRRVLNLFSYTGWLGLAAVQAGADLVWNVDSSAAALETAARFHAGPEGRQRFTCADVFDWLPALAADAAFDLVIADPAPMTSRMSQTGRALAAYRRLYAAVARHVAPGGRVVACCCTSRVSEPAFRRAVEEGLGPGFRFERRLPPEIDHPVGFPQADYLKIELHARAPGP
jgi:23S rRNA (cytosine1962-C5)-methyltransferase